MPRICAGSAGSRFCAALAGLALALPRAAAAAEPPTVVAVELRSDAPLADAESLAAALSVEAGRPLAPAAVEASLRALAAAGVAAETEAWQLPAPGGVTVAFVVRAAVQVAEVRLEGDLGLPAERLRAALGIRAGQPLVEDRVLRGLAELEELCRAEGFLEASARLGVEVDAASRRATITYRLAAGRRTRVGAVRFEGDLGPFGEAELAKALRLATGADFRAAVLRNEPDRLLRWLYRRDHRLAEVEGPELRQDAETGLVDLVYRIDAGPRFELTVVGAERKELERRGLLPFLGPFGYDEALLLQSADLVKRHFQERGHYRVRVETREERDAERLRVRLEVEPGPVFRLEELRFTGNAEVPTSELARRMTTAPRRALAPRSGRLVDEVLAADLTNLRSTYALLGFGKAKVGPAEIAERGEALTLTVPIVEGPRRRVESVELQGIERLDRERLHTLLPLAPEGPYHRIHVDRAVEIVRGEYAAQGFAQVYLSAEVAWDEAEERARVTISVLEGPQSRIGRVVVRGQRRTPAHVIERYVALPPGSPASPDRLLAVERDLYRLGIFSRVKVDLAPGAPLAEEHTVVVDVEEGRTRRVAVGAGYDSESGARALLSLGEANRCGRARHLQLDLLGSRKDERYRLIYTEPRLAGLPVSATATTYWEARDRDAYAVERWGTQVGLAHERGPWRLRLLYDYHIVDLPRIERIFDVPVGSREGRVSSLTPLVAIERRDDPLDPRRGWSALAQVQYAFPFLSADADFLKLFGQTTWSLDLSRLGTVAASVRGGIIEPLGEEIPSGSFLGPVPVDERFYAGGRTTHRAFGQDELGIEGATLAQGTPVGGNGLFLVNLDYRFPIAGAFGGTVFLDGGNVWRDHDEIDTRDLRWGAGVGLRYRSPVGPLRLEIGWKLDREPGEPSYVWFFSIGNPF
ncbi:MAG: BamA/TamA family outer membrane protein [Thermoanaerobaculia bacterium]|nr:BamA/TamA family outer membrane protein [Thermoanaerobaculia bacterium]